MATSVYAGIQSYNLNQDSNSTMWKKARPESGQIPQTHL